MFEKSPSFLSHLLVSLYFISLLHPPLPSPPPSPGLFRFGRYVCDDTVGGWTPELFAVLYKISFWVILLGMGPALSLFLLDSGGNETAQMASTWMRLLFGGIELMAFTVFANVVEGKTSRTICCLHSCTQGIHSFDFFFGYRWKRSTP